MQKTIMEEQLSYGPEEMNIFVRIPTNQHQWNIFEKSFQNESTNQIFKVRTHESGFTSPQIQICMDLGIANRDFKGFFHAIVPKICGDSLDLRKTGWIIWKIAGFMAHDTKQIFSIQDS